MKYLMAAGAGVLSALVAVSAQQAQPLPPKPGNAQAAARPAAPQPGNTQAVARPAAPQPGNTQAVARPAAPKPGNTQAVAGPAAPQPGNTQAVAGPAAPKPANSQPAEAGPRYTAAGELIRPADFRDWRFVTSGLGMTYNAPTGATRTPNFTNVWVNPSSYDAFIKTGQWPDKTMFILEVRASASEGSINKGGHFQSNLVVIEASVKDEARFPGKWAYFDFGRDMKPHVQALPRTERCYACHTDNGAVDNTFVQFYPTLLDVAQRMGTLRPGFAVSANGSTAH